MKKTIKQIFSALFLAVLVCSIFAIPASAQILSEDMKKSIDAERYMAGSRSFDVNAEDSLTVTISKVITAFLSLLGIIFVILLILGGFWWMTAGGDESKVEKAKNTISRAIIGLIITVSAYSISYFVFKVLE